MAMQAKLLMQFFQKSNFRESLVSHARNGSCEAQSPLAHGGLNALIATRGDQGFGVGEGSVCSLPLFPSDAAKEEEVVG